MIVIADLRGEKGSLGMIEAVVIEDNQSIQTKPPTIKTRHSSNMLGNKLNRIDPAIAESSLWILTLASAMIRPLNK